MRRWIVDGGALALLVVAGLISIPATVGWPTRVDGMSLLRYLLLATVFVPYLVRAWAGRDAYVHRAGEAVVLLLVNLSVIAAVAWAALTLSREALLAIMVVSIQGAFGYVAWRRVRLSRGPGAASS
jgi:hypothetical protein